jgi:uncharacterized protein
MSDLDATLSRWFGAIRAGDVATLREAATGDIEVRWNGPPGIVPWAGVWTGAEQVARFFGLVGQHLEVSEVQILERIEGSEGVALVIEGLWKIRSSGEAMRLRAANLLTIRDGKVARFQVFPDSHAYVAALARAMG